MYEKSRFTVWAESWATEEGVVWELVLRVRPDGMESTAPVAHALDSGLTLDEAQGLLDEALGAVGLRGAWRRSAKPEVP